MPEARRELQGLPCRDCPDRGETYRLLSEAEREYVARAGTTTPFWWGSSITPKQANYDPSACPQLKRDGSTVAVDSFEPNPWGLYNVHGNVWEWTEDRCNRSNSGNPGDGRASHRLLSRPAQRVVPTNEKMIPPFSSTKAGHTASVVTCMIINLYSLAGSPASL